jgi:DNA-binding transcriptional MerR regulator
MEKKSYTISDLEQVTGLNRRTIHFYTKERLIPPPDGAGGGARYGEEHALRLKLVGEMQKSHLKLSGIREALDAMSIEEKRSLAEKIDESPHRVWDREALESWITQNESISQNYLPSAPAPRHLDEEDIKPLSFLKMGKERKADIQQDSANYLQNLRRSPPVREESWQRFQVTEGLEINVRSDVVRRYRQQIMHLVEELKRNIR